MVIAMTLTLGGPAGAQPTIACLTQPSLPPGACTSGSPSIVGYSALEGYVVTASGAVYNIHGPAPGIGAQSLVAPIVGMAPFINRYGTEGYWLVARDGGVFAFGATGFYGSMSGHHLNAPVVGMATGPGVAGYWLVASDGGVFSFDLPFYGSMGGHHLNAPIVGMASTPDGGGYWLVASDGGIFAFGDASFYGSVGGQKLNAPIVGIVAPNNTAGYYLAGADGGVFAFGNAMFYGSGVGYANSPVVGISGVTNGSLLYPPGTAFFPTLATASGELLAFGPSFCC
jgi:hypothetical protein